MWHSDGKRWIHTWHENSVTTKFPKDVELKEGYILGGDGKYYEDK